MSLESMKVSELKELLREKNLKVGGKKTELIERLIENGYGGNNLGSQIRKMNLSLSETMKEVSGVYGLDFDYFKDFLSEIGETKPQVEEVHIPQTEEELEKLKVKDLKEILKNKGAKVGGKKSELIERIMELNEAEEKDEEEKEAEEEAEEENEEAEEENDEENEDSQKTEEMEE